MKAILLIWTVNGLGGYDLQQVPMETYDACKFADEIIELQLNKTTVNAFCILTQ